MAQANANALHQLLNIVLGENKERSISDAKQYLVGEGYLDESGEPTSKAWKLQNTNKG